MTLAPGARFGPYDIVSLIGAGGMGEVYLARDARLQRQVALKVLPAAAANDDRSRARLLQEARAAAKLDHPNICPVFEVGDADGHSFIAMQFVDGETLAVRLRRARLDIASTLAIARQIAAALAEAHRHGIVHRDIKPQNVIVAPSGRVRVLDFGVAKAFTPDVHDAETAPLLTEAGAISGTVPYMSPEQLKGEVVDARSDIFSFGTLLYEMIVGAHPFQAASGAETTSSILTKDAPVPDTIGTSEIRRVIGKCLQKDRDRRYQSTRDLVIDLNHTADDLASTARPPVATRRPHPMVRLFVLFTVVVAAALALWQYRRTSSPWSTAVEEPVQLTDLADSATAPAISPDGRMVAFIRGGSAFLSHGDIFVKSLPNGEPVRLTNDPDEKYAPVFTPDGQRVAFTMIKDLNGKASWDTWTVPITGVAPPSRLLPNASGLSWIDDRHVLFSEIQAGTPLHMGIVTSTDSRADARLIYLPAHERAMAHFSYPSPDRKWLLIVEMNRSGAFDRCRLMPFDGKAPAREVGPATVCWCAAWSRDGQWMYFNAVVGGASHLWRQRFPDGAVEQIKLGPASEEQGVAVTPDGRGLITAIGHRQSSLWMHDASGDRLLSSEGFASSPRISRDGKRVYFLLRRAVASPVELSVLDIASGKVDREVPDHEAFDFDVSSDETMAAFTTRTSSGPPEVWVAAMDHASAPRLVATSADSPMFGPSQDLVFRALEGRLNFIDRLNLRDAARSRVSTIPVVGIQDVSPDRQWLIVWRPALGETAVERLEAVPVNGGEPKLLSTSPARIAWSADGHWLYVSNNVSRSTALPLRPGQIFPPFPVEKDEPAAVWMKQPNGRIIEHVSIAAVSDPSEYVFQKVSDLRNLFWIPLPPSR